METATLVDRVERELRDEIVRFDLAPAARLRMATLVERYRTGATPIREALSRLMREGLVEFTANKGFRVPGLSRDDLADLVAARTAVEVEAVRLSIANGDDHWEAGIVGALHRFRRKVDTAGEDDGVPVDLPQHDDLHLAMSGGSGSPRLLELQQRLLTQHKRYQRISRLRYTREQHVQEHVDLADAILARNADAAITLLRAHLRLSLDALDQQDFWADEMRDKTG